MRVLPTAFACSLVLSSLVAQDELQRFLANDYLVLAAVSTNDPFDVAAQELAARHHAEIVRFDPKDLEPLRPVLATVAPRQVAIVLRREQLDFNLQRRFLQLATEIDDDPFVDFAFGYITGATADEALALAKRGAARTPVAIEHGIATVAGGVDKSMCMAGAKMLRRTQLDELQICCAGEKVFADTGRDVAFLQQHLPELKGREAITFVGHGMPWEVVGGPTFAELAGLDLTGAVVLDVACYTGVTSQWYEDDYQRSVVHAREVPLDESFCLALLRTGVVGYTAYLCPRPAGPELDCDLAALVVDGMSLGDARRRDYDKTVLGYLGFGDERMRLAAVRDGMALKPGRDAVRDIMLEGATGGVVFGDPACVPFVAREGDAPVAIDCQAKDGAIVVVARAGWQATYSQCSDPTARWGDGLAMKVYARVPLGARHVTDVVVDELRIGTTAQPSRVLWAVEVDHGERFVQLKVNFPRPQQFTMESLRLTARVLTTDDAAAGKLRAGEIAHAAPAATDVRSHVLTETMRELAKSREVTEAAMQDALDASSRLLGDKTANPEAVAALTARGSEGFRAVVVLCEAGHVHYRTWELFKATWHPGDERHLLALASGPQLPNWAMWTVFEGLGVADTPAVRTFLRERLASETDAGLFMAVAKAMSHLGERAAIAPIADRVLEARDGWQGVEPHLVAALGEFGGKEAAAALQRIVLAGGRSRAAALATLAKVDAEAAAKLKGAGEGGR